MRRSLYLKDDDYRLSFLYGNFTTLTRFTEADLERVVTERLGPLYVSIHATDPDVRTQLLRNRRGATSLRWLAALLDAGIDVHGQVVVCPGINDGAVLDDTLLGVLDRFPRLLTVGVVPLGVSDYTNERDMCAHTTAEAAVVLDTVTRWQQRFRATVGRRVVFAADEYYVLAQRPFPDPADYEGFPQHENGIGMVRAFESDVVAALRGDQGAGMGLRTGFFAWVDGAPADGYRAPRAVTGTLESPVDRATTAREVGIVTGEYGARVLAPLLPALRDVAAVPVRLVAVPNRFFGGNIAVTGLLTGRDVSEALAAEPLGDRYLVPDVVLSRDRFLDGTTVTDLPRPVEVVPTDGASLVAALR
jgi:NifB/MoaA-like Fe-S oxidoreductase